MKIFALSLIVVASLLVAHPAHATVVVAAGLEELAQDAGTIVRGRVVEHDARWTADRRRVETLVTIEAESYLKGALGTLVQFRVPGGQLGRFRSIFVGAPSFVPGQRVVVFLGARRHPFVWASGRGSFHVSRQQGGR